MEDKILHIAQKYGEKIGCGIIAPAGNNNGLHYFDLINKSLIGKKTGLPHIIKINNAGKIFPVDNLTEIMWAIQQKKNIKEALK